MHKLLKSLLATAGFALLLAGVAQAKDEPKTATTPATPAAAAPAAAPATTAKPAAGAPMDINSASEEELATLPKIGPVRAKAIVAGRPYRAKNELLDKKIIPKDAYNSIKDMVIAKHQPGAAAVKK
jgi:DNA uptake protein ComE-like DNA-binding protein